MARITRRTFLLGSVAAAATATIGSYVAWQRNTPERFVIHAVRRNLAGYDIDEMDLKRFAASYLEHEHNIMQQYSVRLAMRLRRIFFSKFVRKFAPQQNRYNLEWLERRIMTRFVQSTDLLYSPEDSRKISYIQYWDPYVRGCGNPMARFDFN